MAKKKTSRGTNKIPAEAKSQGAINDSTPKDQRAPANPDPDNLDDGPKMGEFGEFLPASYQTNSGNIRTDR